MIAITITGFAFYVLAIILVSCIVAAIKLGWGIAKFCFRLFWLELAAFIVLFIIL